MLRASFAILFLGIFLGAGARWSPSHAGTIQCTPLGADGFDLCHAFIGTDGEFPEAGLSPDRKGNLYGTTFGDLGGGAPGKKCGGKSCGTADALFPGKLKVLHPFEPGDGDGAFPTGELAVQRGGVIYGTTEYGAHTACGGLGCGTVFSLTKSSHEYKLRGAGFCQQPNCVDGGFPRAGLIADSSLGSANLYGTTTLGGMGAGYLCGSDLGGCGTVYQLAAGVVDPVPIYSFCTQVANNVCTDGAVPYSRLFLDKKTGALFGTTEFGGANSQGVVFMLTPPSGSGPWTESVLYSFCGMSACSDGAQPEAGVVLDKSGNIYGTTTYGGMPCDGNSGCGVVYKLSPQGDRTYNETVLYRFAGLDGDDGDLPQNQLVIDSFGNLYGTTLRGGVVSGGKPCKFGGKPVGCGTVFELVGAAADGYERLHVFGISADDCAVIQQSEACDGVHPEGALLLQNDDEYLYGAARTGGDTAGTSPCNCGTYYRIDLTATPARRIGSRSLRAKDLD